MGIVLMTAGGFIILAAAILFLVSYRVFQRRKRRIREEMYHIYE